MLPVLTAWAAPPSAGAERRVGRRRYAALKEESLNHMLKFLSFSKLTVSIRRPGQRKQRLAFSYLNAMPPAATVVTFMSGFRMASIRCWVRRFHHSQRRSKCHSIQQKWKTTPILPRTRVILNSKPDPAPLLPFLTPSGSVPGLSPAAALSTACCYRRAAGRGRVCATPLSSFVWLLFIAALPGAPLAGTEDFPPQPPIRPQSVADPG